MLRGAPDGQMLGAPSEATGAAALGRNGSRVDGATTQMAVRRPCSQVLFQSNVGLSGLP
jgi:hypothetical protein